MRKIFIVLPAYNEEKSIFSLLNRIKSYFEDIRFWEYEVIVVNDGSKDNTLKVIRSCIDELPLKIINHEKNMGLGPTLNDGLYEAARISEDNDIIITMDGDDTHNPGLIHRMIFLILEGHDIVIASRYRKGSRIFGLSLFRKLISYFASWLFRIILPIKGVRDFTCGYRAFRAKVIKSGYEKYGDQFIDQQGFQVTVDILFKLSKMNFVFGEVPFILRYDYKADASKMNVKSTILRTLKLIFIRKIYKN